MIIKRNSIGPKILPPAENEIAIPAAIIRSVPHMRESPTPAIGPIKDALTALIDVSSKSELLAFSSSIAANIPYVDK